MPPSLRACGASPTKHAHLFMMSPTQMSVTKDGGARFVALDFARTTGFCLPWVALFSSIKQSGNIPFLCFSLFTNLSVKQTFFLLLSPFFFLQGCRVEMLHNMCELGLLAAQFLLKTGPNTQSAGAVCSVKYTPIALCL